MLLARRIVQIGPLRQRQPSHWYSLSARLQSPNTDTVTVTDSDSVTVQWILKDGSTRSTEAHVGSNLLQVAHRFGIELEGACEGVCACSTCHVILQKDIYDHLQEASEEEEDMLDRAFGLTPTSRLGCQVRLEKSHNQIIVKLPKATRNFYVDGHVPKPH